jgi:5S rRNA maturation endonuclease (ribonuclease M5)
MIYFSQPLYIAEGDIDYFSVYNINPNTIGMVGNNIEKLCDDLQSYGYSEKVYLLMDCDSPSNKKIHDLKQKLRQKKYSFIIIDSRHVMNQA